MYILNIYIILSGLLSHIIKNMYKKEKYIEYDKKIEGTSK